MGKNMGRMAYSKLNSIIRQVEDIRKQWQFRMDADSESENKNQNQSGKKKKTALGTRLPYGLCKDLGIDTTGMTPREAWDAYYGKTGVSKKEAFEEKIESGDKDIDPEEATEEAEPDIEEEPDDSDDYDWSEEELKAYEDLKKLLGKDMPPLPGTEPESEAEPSPAVEEEKEPPKEETAPEESKKAVHSTENAKEINLSYESSFMNEYASKVPKPKMDTSVKSLSGWGSVASEYADMQYALYDSVLGCKTVEELVETQQKLQAVMDNAEICCNVNSEHLESIVTDHLMNQFETGTTCGSSNLKARRAAAKNMFGLGKASADEREKYGYMADKGDFDTTLGSRGPGYGYGGNGSRCVLTFRKDTMAERTTYTMSDSLYIADHGKAELSAGALDTTCSIEGLSCEERIAEKLRSGEYKSIKDMVYKWDGAAGKTYGDTCYVEAQFHGNVTGKDIESIRFGTAYDMEKAMSGWGESMWNALVENDISVGYFDDNQQLVTKNAKELKGAFG